MEDLLTNQKNLVSATRHSTAPALTWLSVQLALPPATIYLYHSATFGPLQAIHAFRRTRVDALQVIIAGMNQIETSLVTFARCEMAPSVPALV
jgi:hypothetical protein